jgi:hypothetical protein
MIATVATLQARVGQDVAGWLTRNSLAFDWPRYSKGKYAGVQKESAPGVVPWAYRACIRNGGRPSECSEDANDRQ